jgi:hypothetical protein
MADYSPDYPVDRVQDPPYTGQNIPLNRTPLPPANPFRASSGPSGPAPSAPMQNGFLGFLQALFGGGGAPQGMTGLLTPRGQAGTSTDALGNPFGRFR